MKQRIIFFSLLLIFSTISLNLNSNTSTTLNFESLFTGIPVNEMNSFKVFDKHVLKNQKIVVIKFFTPTCYPCVMTKRPFENLAQEFANKSVFIELEATKFPQLSSQLQVLKVPTFICFSNGQAKQRFEGAPGINQVRNFLTSN